MATGLGAEEARGRVEEARAEGIEVTPGQEFTSQLGGTAIGLTELAPIERLTGPLQAVLRGVKKSDADMIAPGLFNSAKRMVETGGIEGLQEGMANVAQDLLAKGIYNPNLEVGDSALGDAAMGASVGAFAQGAIELVTRGRRKSLYESLKTEEEQKTRDAEAEKARLAKETARKQTLTNFGVEGQPLLLAAPQGQITPSRQEKSSLDQYGVEDKDLFEPYGTFTRDELDKDVVKELDKRRDEAGRPKTETFTLQDIADTGVYRGELNRLIAQRSGYTGETKFKPSEVVGLAEQKNIDTSTQGFSDFVGRVTGKKPLPEKTGLGALQGLNDVEIFAVREAINKLPTYEQRKILPTGKAAKIFDDKQATRTLTNIKKTLGQDLGEKGLGETSVLKEIGDFSGLKDVNDQQSLLEKYIADGELERVSTPAVAVLDANGKQVSVVEGSTQAERVQAQKKAQEIGGTIKDTSINQIRTPDPVNRLIGGFDIREGTFEDTLIDGYDITTETGEVIGKTKSLTDAENRVNRATELRKQRQLQLLDAKQKIQENIAKSEQAMADLEALGKKDSEDFKKIQNSMAAQERNLAKVEQNLIEFGKKVAFKSRYKQQKRTGFTLFEGNKPVGTYNSRQEALEASVVSQPTDRLEAMLEAFPTLSASAKPGMDRADIKKLQQVAASELASRKGEIPSGVGITVEGDITAAEERLALQGIFSPRIKERVNELDKKLRAALDKLGLKDVRLNIVAALRSPVGSADGIYAARLIKIALDAENPMRALRHEGIHALKELGAFTPDQWRVLENKAKSEWMAKYNIAGRYEDLNLDQASMLEEAISDAFSDFSQTKPPAGLIGNVFSRIKSFFAALDNGFKGLGFQTADDVFGQVERGELLPGMGERAAEVQGLQAQRVVAETPERYQLRDDKKGPRILKNGQIVGAPPDARTVRQRTGLVTRMTNLLDSPFTLLNESKNWYEDSGAAIREITRGDPELTERVVRLMALYSQANGVGGNTTATIRSIYQLATDSAFLMDTRQPTAFAGRFPNTTAERIPAILAAPTMDDSIPGVDDKLMNFYRNLHDATYQTNTFDEASTIDRWMMRLFGYPHSEDQDVGGATGLSKTQYDYAKDIVRRIGDTHFDRTGERLLPRQIQAALWTYVKNKTDYDSLSKEKQKTFVPSIIDFSDYITRATANITWETRPSTSVNFLPGIHQAPRNQKENFNKAVRSIFEDENGNDLIFQLLGGEQLYSSQFSIGAYENQIAPNVITRLVLRKDDKEYITDAANKYASIVGYVTKQDAVPWYRADPTAGGKLASVGYRVTASIENVDADFEQRLFDHLNDVIPGIGFTRINNSFDFVNFRGNDGKPSFLPDKKYKTDLLNALEFFPEDIKFNIEPFRAESAYISNNWKENTNGEGYLTAFSPGELANIRDTIDGWRSAYEQIGRDYAQEFGWDRRDGGRRDQGRSLAPLEGAPVIQGATGPDPRLVDVAEAYAQANNIPYTRQGEYVEINPEFAESLAAAYEAMPHDPKNKKVKEAFADLAKQVRQQYDALVNAGYQFTFFDSTNDPYDGNPWNAMRDLRTNKRMAVYGTYDGYGTEGITGAAIENNPMLQDTGLRWPDQEGVTHPVTVNDLFRAVHDAFGHGLEGAGFRARGEENAFQAHARLFTGPALGALATETRGQNSWMNFGPHAEKNKTAKVEDSVFAEQKTGLLPEWAWKQNIAPAQKYSLRTANTPEFKQWFGQSQIVDEQGRPRVMYHGTARDITEFKPKQAGAIFVTEDPRFAEDFSYMSEMWMIDHADQFLSEQEIKKAVAAGVAKMAQGVPKQDQIRMLTQILQFPINSVVRDPDATEIRNEIAKRLPSKPNILPVYVRAERPFDFENQGHLEAIRSMPGVPVHYQRIRRGEWSAIEEPAVQEAIQDLGFDGFYIKEGGRKNLAVYDPNQLKSVTGNIGTYGQRDPTINEAKQFGLTVEEAKAAQKRGDIRYSLRNTNTPEFKQWLRKSPIVDAVGKPQMMFHGTSLDIEEFIPGQTGAIYVSPDPEFAGTFARYSQEREIRKLGENLDQDLEVKQRILDPIIDEAMANGDLTNRDLPYHRDLARVGLIKDLDQYSKEYWMNWFLEKPMRDAAHSTGVGPALREALANMLTTGRNVMPLYVNPQKPFDYENNTHVNKVAKLVFEYDPDTYESANPKVQKYQRDTLIDGLKAGDWRVLEEPIVQEAIKELGFDAFYVKEQDTKNLGLYKPNQLKSAIGNTGAFSPETGKVRYSLRNTDTPAFKQWFGDSKVVDKKGDPLVVYHGTDKTFDAFNLRKRGSRVGFQDDGFYFSDSPGTATTYATMDVYSGALGKKKDAYLEPTDFFKRFLSRLGLVESAPQVVPAFLSIKNPYKTTGARMPGRRELIKQGYDGIQYTQYDGTTHWVAFEPTQIKSSIGNIGTFDPENPDIRYSLRQQAGQTLGQSYLNTVQRTTTPRVEKGFKDRISEAMSATPFAKFRQMFINKYERIEYFSKQLAKQFGDAVLLADQSAIAAALMSDRAAGVAAESFKSGIPVYAKGYTYVDNMGGKVKGLMEILMPLAQKQDPFVYQMYQDYAARRRGVRLDSEGKITPFTRQELSEIPKIEKAFPEFKQVFEDYQRYNEGLVRYMRDTGVIDAKAAQEWMRYGDYVPFYRQLEGESTVGPSIFSAISGVKAPKKLKGGDAPLGEFLETVVRNSRAAIEAGMRNVAANRVVNNFQRLNSPSTGGRLVEKTSEQNKNRPDVVTVRENGKDAYYKVADPLLVQSLQALNIPQIPGLDILAKPAEFLREMVTRDPAFIGASVLRESLSAWITTGQKLTPVASGVNQFVKILANASPTVQALRRAGIGSGYEFKGDVQATAGVFGDQLKRMAGEMTTAQKAVMPLRAMWDGLDKASTAADLSTRAAVFERVMQETGNEAEAIYQAMEVINFSRKGSSPIIQIFAAIIPFLNARIQGLDLLYRAGFGELASATKVAQQKAFMLRSLALFGTTAMYYAHVQDEEEWQRADQETRDNYWIIGNMKFPIPFELGVIFKVMPERIMAYTMGEDTGQQVLNSIGRNIAGTLSFNPIPQAVLPLVEASSNYSFFLGRDIVGMGKKDLAPEFQTSEGTSQIAIQLGQTLGLSPMKIDYVIRGYTGAMGTYAITAMDSIIRSEDDATKATWRLDQIPVLKRFMISDLGAGTVNEYYDLREKLDEVVRTSNQLERTGNIEALQEYLKDNGQVLGMKDYIRSLDKDMKSLRESRMAINMSRMEPDQKREALDSLRRAEISLTERIGLLRSNLGV
jgi:hypothetical protein